MEFIRLTSTDAKERAKGSTKELGKVTLPKGKYRVLGFTKEDQDIDGDPRKWLNIHLEGIGENKAKGSMSFGRFLTAGLSDVPVKGKTKQRYYFPTLPIKCAYEGDAADFAMELDGGDVIVELEVVEGMNPNFVLSSWEKEAEALAVKEEKGFSTKNFYRVKTITKPKAKVTVIE